MDFGWAMAALGKALGPHVAPLQALTLHWRCHSPMPLGKLLADAGFEVHSSGSVTTVSEFADADIAYRALASTGMIYPLVQHGGPRRHFAPSA